MQKVKKKKVIKIINIILTNMSNQQNDFDIIYEVANKEKKALKF
eukprot:UN06407